jgi:hypothetical protein
MRTLVAFGDSFTYGHGLIDCWIKNGDEYTVNSVHSEYAWPSLLANDLKYNMVNRSKPGFSNLAILHRILNTKFDDNSLCVIMWSYPSRDMIFKQHYRHQTEMFSKKIDNDKNTWHVGHWQDSDLSKNWLLTHNNTDLVMRTWFHIHHANLFLESMNIPHYNFFVDYSMIKAYKPMYCNIPFKDITMHDFLFLDRALDGSHPGPLTQERMAKDIKQALIEAEML